MKGIVYKSTGSWYAVKADNGTFYDCRLRGKFKNDDLKVTNPIAVGDVVVFDLEEGLNTGVIYEISPRTNYIIRRSSRKKHFAHIVASNIDQAMLMVTLRSPRTSTGFINRFLVSAESFRIPVIIVFNKTDLYRKQEVQKEQEWKAMYEPLGYRCMSASVLRNEGIEEIVKALANKTTLVAGHSGVGKSSLLNTINPDLDLAIGGLTKFTDKGSHTTTYAEIYEIGDNSRIIDTPGMKEFGLEGMGKAEVSHYFPEMRSYLGECKYHNCIHINEPDCKVIEALRKGEVAESRYLTYLSLLDELEE